MWMTALITLAVAHVCFGLLLCGCQRSLMYFPDQTLPSPDAVGLPGAEVVTLETEDGLRLISWFLRSESRPFTAVVFHGNAGNISHRGFLADVLWQAGYSVLLVEYRGYGGNPGSPTEEGLYRDARAAIKYLKSRGDVDMSRLVYLGKSLGGGPATQLAIDHPPAGLALDSPFTSMPAVAAEHYWYLPVRWMVLDKYDNLSKIAEVNCPVLIMHGDSDRIVPTKFGRKLHETANEPKQLLIIPNAGHNNNVDVGRAEYIEALKELLRRAEKRVKP